jgi:hypothetical protein
MPKGVGIAIGVLGLLVALLVVGELTRCGGAVRAHRPSAACAHVRRARRLYRPPPGSRNAPLLPRPDLLIVGHITIDQVDGTTPTVGAHRASAVGRRLGRGPGGGGGACAPRASA